MNEYAEYIQQLPQGQAGKLPSRENENPLTIRRRLVTAAQVLGVPLIIKRSGETMNQSQNSALGYGPDAGISLK
jgi:hypothetical protein